MFKICAKRKTRSVYWGYIDIEGVPSLGVSLVVLETHEKKKQVEAKVLYKIEVAITVVRKAPYAMCLLCK